MIRIRTLIGVALVVFLVLGGSGVAFAYWSTQATATATVVAAGAGAMSQDGFSALAISYSAPSRLGVTAPVTVTNDGTDPATYSLALGRQSGNALTAGVSIRSWKVASTAACTAASVETGTVLAGTWDNMPKWSGTLAASGSEVICYRTSITSAQASSFTGISMVGTLSLTSSNTWSSPVSATVNQNVADTTPPTTPTGLTASGTSSSSTTLRWFPSTDNVTPGPSIVYEVYRDGVKFASIATTMNPVSLTVAFLSPSTTYTFSVKAKDQAGNYSAPASVTVRTAA